MHAAQLVIGALVIAVVQQQAQQQAPPPAAPSPVSVEHVRDALEKPSRLTIRTPDFFVHIEQRRPMQDIFDTPPWQLPPIGWRVPPMGARTAFGTIPIVNVDLLSIARSMSDARRANAARNASDEVRSEIAAYCAAQPDRATILMCPNR